MKPTPASALRYSQVGCGRPVPSASTLNFGVGQTVAGTALVRVGPGGDVCVSSPVSVQLIVDVAGFFR